MSLSFIKKVSAEGDWAFGFGYGLVCVYVCVLSMHPEKCRTDQSGNVIKGVSSIEGLLTHGYHARWVHITIVCQYNVIPLIGIHVYTLMI